MRLAVFLAALLLTFAPMPHAVADDRADCEARNDKSIAACTRIIKKGPETAGMADTYYRRGMRYRDNEEYDKAIQDFTKALRLKPGWSWTLIARGHAYSWSKRHTEAIADQELAVKLDPSDVAYSARGMDLMAAGELDRALADFNKSIELNPKRFYAYLNRGHLYMKRSKHREALSDYRMALEIGSPYEAENQECRDGIKKAKKELGE